MPLPLEMVRPMGFIASCDRRLSCARSGEEAVPAERIKDLRLESDTGGYEVGMAGLEDRGMDGVAGILEAVLGLILFWRSVGGFLGSMSARGRQVDQYKR